MAAAIVVVDGSATAGRRGAGAVLFLLPDLEDGPPGARTPTTEAHGRLRSVDGHLELDAALWAADLACRTWPQIEAIELWTDFEPATDRSFLDVLTPRLGGRAVTVRPLDRNVRETAPPWLLTAWRRAHRLARQSVGL